MRPMVSEAYECGACGATGVRIYRPGGEFFRRATLRCAPCVRARSRPGANDREPTGTFPVQLNGHVAAVSSPSGEPYGLTSIPRRALDAWLALPERGEGQR